MKCKVWLHLDREYNLYFKEDRRLSVTLNNPREKNTINKETDYWEANYPYSSKNVIQGKDGKKVVLPQVSDDFGTMARMHDKKHQNFKDDEEEKKQNKSAILKYHEMQDEDDENAQ